MFTRTRYTSHVLGAVMLTLSAPSVFAADCCSKAEQSAEQKAAATCAVPASDVTPQQALSADEIHALNVAIQDEYMSRATYARVIADFGEVRPFINIIQAENRHIDALTVLFNRYGVPIPEDTWPTRVPAYGSAKEACAAAVTAEVENGALYDTIMPKVEHADLIHVMTNLRDASIQRHLPAFQRCAEGGGGAGAKSGHGQGRGQNGQATGQGRGQRGKGMGQGRGAGRGRSQR